ncbi:MAG: hypothetical protein ABJC36_01385 [Gemmatimonadales bacterium]
MGSIPTRSRHLFPAPLRSVACFLVGLSVFLTLPAEGAAQDSAAVATDSAARVDTTIAAAGPRSAADSLALRTSPMNAFWRSFLLPGWGQAKVGRKLTAGIFIAWEGTTLAMSLKTRHELAYLRRTNSARAEDKRREHEDWLVLMAFNHLFAGLEAYVSGHLTDFPPDLRLQALPGGVGASVSIPFRLR